jgi:membrane associated rhomboid family serine protease
MNSWNQLKYSFLRNSSMVKKLILLNAAVFVLLNLVILFSFLLTGVRGSGHSINEFMFLPAAFGKLLYRPWALISYMFAQEGFLHLLLNMLWLYFLGSLFQEYLGEGKLLLAYLWGGISGGIVYMAGMNLIPVLHSSPYYHVPLQGASAGVLAIVVGIATLLPNYSIRVFVFDIKLKYIAAAWAVFSLIGIGGKNAGGNLAHLGGILFGYFYIRTLRHYTFLDRISSPARNFFRKLIKRKKDEKKIFSSYTVYKKNIPVRQPDSDEVDAILDKINKSGYDSLTRDEKETLFKASQQD